MTYQQHRNHMVDGDYPVDGCYWCALIVRPSLRVKRKVNLSELDIYADLDADDGEPL